VSESAEARFADDAHRYRLDSRIATGGMGEVWRGTDTTLGRQVAVKLLKIEYADDASFRSRFETEARHAASLHHPGVAAVYDFGEASPRDGSEALRPYLVMELVDGQPLSALLRPGEPMDPVVTRDLLAQAADAIGAAHAAGIVHRDIKPANLLVTPARQMKITDFGIARAADGVGLTQTGQVMGTPQYLSPEQARGGTATPASDVYSLGCVAFECLAGRRPFVAETPIATALAHLREPVPPLPDEVPADLAAVVRRALAKEPRERFADGAAFATALRDPATAATDVFAPAPTGDQTQVMGAGTAVAAAAGADATGPTAAESTTDRKRTRAVPWLLIGGIALLLALVGSFLVFALGGDVITGFPGERDDDHQATVALVRSLPFTSLHVFPYSARPDTAAERLPQLVSGRASRARAAELRDLAALKADAHVRSRLGGEADVVVIRDGDAPRGLTEDYLDVALEGATPARSERFVATLALRDGALVAEARGPLVG